jgi:hypothetical protein
MDKECANDDLARRTVLSVVHHLYVESSRSLVPRRVQNPICDSHLVSWIVTPADEILIWLRQGPPAFFCRWHALALVSACGGPYLRKGVLKLTYFVVCCI